MRLSKMIGKYTGLSISTAFVLLIILSSCRMGTEPQAIAESGEETAILKITVPNIAPWLKQQVDNEEMTRKAWLDGDSIEFRLFEPASPSTPVETIFISGEIGPDTSTPLVTNWEVAPGSYFIRSLVFNENSNLYLSGTYASVWGIYPEQDLLNPTESFSISAGESMSILITNFPTYPTEIGNDVWPAEETHSEPVYGEKWFIYNTGPDDTNLWVWVGATSLDGVVNGDVGLYLFGPDGVFIDSSAYINSADPVEDEVEELDSYYDGFAVQGGATYYVGVYVFAPCTFEMYFQSS